MTALVASIGFISASYRSPSRTVWVRKCRGRSPRSWIGGLVTSTLLTLFVVPTLYVWMKGRREQSSEERDVTTREPALQQV